MEPQPWIFLGIKVKPGPVERFKLENFPLDNTVDAVKAEAEKKSNVPSASLELIHHGKILKDEATLQDCGVINGEMIYVLKKRVLPPPQQPPSFSDSELQQLNTALRTLGCTPNAPGWTRAMQLLNDESVMAEIIEQAPSLGSDCVALSMLHEVELLAALGANVGSMRRGAAAHPALPAALRHLTRLVRSRTPNPATANDNAPTSGFVYSLEALSEDEDADEEEAEDGERNTITQEQLAVALQAATEAVSTPARRGAGAGSHDSLLRLLRAGDASASPAASTPSADTASPAGGRPVITPEMFSEAISEAITRASRQPPGTPMDHSAPASSSQSPGSSPREDYARQLGHMHEMGLLDDALNVRALIIAAGDVNAAINLVFSGAIGDD